VSVAATCGSSDPGKTRVEPDDDLTPLRLLRRASIALLGVPPTDEQMTTLIADPDTSHQLAAVDAFVDASLKDPRFYQIIFETARTWMNIPLVPSTADEPEYGAKQQRVVIPCPAKTALEGSYFYWRDSPDTACAKDAPVLKIEPWWASGTTVTLAGNAASTSPMGTTSVQGNPVTITCNGRAEGTCGCGPNAEGCWLDTGTYPGWAPFLYANPDGQRRLLSEEPARLFAHIVWHDRPATDLVLADYSVGPTELQAAYVMQAIAGGDVAMASSDAWWRPSQYSSAPTDPLHQPGDPRGWREFTISQRNTFLLADRNYTFDPRKDSGPSKGFPSAGVLTTPGFLDAYPRERVRAARALETFACEQLLPPDSSVQFNPYLTDPGREGPCQNCHKRIDPAALHFKRWGKSGSAFEGYGAHYLMPGVGSVWRWGDDWRVGPYGDPFDQWKNWYRPGSILTPATEAEVKANPYALFLDFLPPDQTLLGQTSDGTVGPLGFAKMIVAAGAFDRCVVRKVHGRVLGRDIDPTAEYGYLEALTKQFITGGRQVRPFIKALTQGASFRKGG
jgi:hypothetical protein